MKNSGMVYLKSTFYKCNCGQTIERERWSSGRSYRYIYRADGAEVRRCPRCGASLG